MFDFGKLFGMNENFDAESKTNIVDDSKAIRSSVPRVVVQSAWHAYIKIKKTDDAYDSEYSHNTPVWKGLEKVEEYKGNLERFKPEEVELLKALKDGFILYSDVMHILIDHHDDEAAAANIMQTFPDIKEYIPEEFNNVRQLIEVVIEVIRDYQWQIEQFSNKHGAKLDAAIKNLS